MIGKPGPLTGQVLGGRYLLGHVLGKGGCGVVYEAVQQDLGRTVALKVLREARAADRQALARLEIEAKAAAGLEHANIVQVTDFQHQPGEPAFLVMELLRGCSLKDELRRGPISQTRAAYIACQVLSALAQAHAAGIIHRDLKPSNIFLVQISGVRDIVKLLDFGVAKLQSEADLELTETGSAPGTPVYMAPEQLRGGEVDGRIDLYSMGVVLYRAVTGELPFSAPNEAALSLAILENRYVPMSARCTDLSPEFEQVVGQAMARDPGHRHGSAKQMFRALLPWTPSRVEDCLPGLRSPATPREPTLLSRLQCTPRPGSYRASRLAGPATVTLPSRDPPVRDHPTPAPAPVGSCPSRARVAPGPPNIFSESTRRRRPPTLEVVEIIPDDGDEEIITTESRPVVPRSPKPRHSPRPHPSRALLALLLVVGLAAGYLLLTERPDGRAGQLPVGVLPSKPMDLFQQWFSKPDPLLPLLDSAGDRHVDRLPQTEPMSSPQVIEPKTTPKATGKVSRPVRKPILRKPRLGKPGPRKPGPRVAVKTSKKVSRPELSAPPARIMGTVTVVVRDDRGKEMEAEVFVDGSRWGSSPLEVTLAPGKYEFSSRIARCTRTASLDQRRHPVPRVEVRCTGQTLIRRSMEVLEGGRHPLVLEPISGVGAPASDL